MALLDADPGLGWPGGAVFDLGSATLLVHERAEHDGARGEDRVAIAVDDVDAACDVLADRELDIEWPPADYDVGRLAYLRDPDGSLPELVGD